ncbi:OmpA family protein [Promicromonospora thailandica]|uniref:OmpA-OmpF porin, OOP family n=1 Tax=Promicromonospora thailandica TaxID=765201 RepID=A0A9X2G1I5_9MICO|nr:OmpA family protein [Promicromonospora thailandica]MCP2264185.1 OmpA-OmpF porin, OOP family [Promicromonospora thailandica]BFF21148.1 hypothetical protein GCM10025730_46690 [Promicromonospora thailandica]
MNLRVVLPPVIAVALGLGAISAVQNTGFREHIEDTLTASSQEALAAAGLDGVRVDVTGRDADVTAGSDGDALAAADVVSGVTGIRTAVAYGPSGLVEADGGAGASDESLSAEDEAEATAEPEPTADAEPTGEPEDSRSGDTTDAEETAADGETDATEPPSDDEPKRKPTRTERKAAQEDLVEIPNITFVTDSARLTKDGRRVVREAAEVLEEHPEVEVRIEGHTDSLGTEKHNQRLSERRAQAVLDRLVELGVDPDRLTSKGYGESEPLVVPTTYADLEKNRRVEFLVRP